MRIISTVILMWAGGVVAAAAQEAPRSILVQGEGRVAHVPDTAWITMGVVVEGETAQAATEAISLAIGSVHEALTGAGLESSRMQTGQIGLTPRQTRAEDAPPQISGYRAETDIEVQVADPDRLGEIVSTAVEQGATTLHGLRFGLADPGAAEDTALRNAVADAMSKARLVAEAAGVTPGAVLRVEERSQGGDPVGLMRSERSLSAVPVALGEVETSAMVELELSISD